MNIPDGGIILGDQTEDFIRDFAMELISKYVPSTTGDPRFAEIIKNYGGNGTTCGFLCHWLIWRLGCRDSTLVNRSEPADGLHYVDGANISRIFNTHYFVHYKVGMVPSKCDILFLSNGPPSSEHVLVSSEVDDVYSDPPIWTGANAGQRDKLTGKQCAFFIDRVFSNGRLIHDGVVKGIMGWINIAKLPLTALANLNIAL